MPSSTTKTRRLFATRQPPVFEQFQASPAAIAVDPELLAIAPLDAATALTRLGTSVKGLTEAEAATRLVKFGANELPGTNVEGWAGRLLHAVRNPLVILLAVLAIVSSLTGDIRAATVIAVMIALGVVLRFVQETRANTAAAALKEMVHITSLVTRDGVPRKCPVRELVPGDVVTLSAGDMVPADLRLLSAKDLYINQASLTGESLPVEKSDVPQPVTDSALGSPVLCFRGTSVQSGSTTAVVVATASRTYFGQMVGTLVADPTPSSFQRGIDAFTVLMIRLIAIMAPLVFVINGITKHDWKEAFFFSLAVAVGLTPEMLPMIFSVCLSKGAVALSKRQVIVKRLDAIQNLGAIDVLCTDKTGTLTMDAIILERHCDVHGKDSTAVLQAAILVSHFQTGLNSALDDAILAHESEHEMITVAGWTKVDEAPFDFTRRLMSVVVERPGAARRLVAKGAPEEVIARCTHVALDDVVAAIDPTTLPLARAEYEALSREGFRVLAVADRDLPAQEAYGLADEHDLTLLGFVGFLDPPKESARPAIAALGVAGVRVVILTGDNDLVARRICEQVGIPVDHVMVGSEVEALDDEALATAAEQSCVFARLTPGHKQRIIRALQQRGHIVGFLGDGINDAPALHTADIGLSVDSAVDIAKDSADVILLEKSLLVLADGVREGRAVFANILKYIRMGASSNFGNMFSVIGASALLPFVPMAPIQILTNNLLYDFSQLSIPTDRVDDEQIARPRPWSMTELRRYILCIGPLSSIFDYTTYALMYFVLGANDVAHAQLFQTGWFVESLMTQTLVIHVIRTNRIPFFQSMPSIPLLSTTVAVLAIGLWLPVSPFAPALGFVALPAAYWPLLGGTVVAYLVVTQLMKTWLLRRHWI
jgi:Mg2+-importing ATPase